MRNGTAATRPMVSTVGSVSSLGGTGSGCGAPSLDTPLAAGTRLLVPVPSDPIPSAGPECGEEQSPLAGDGHRNQRQALVGAGGRRAAGGWGSGGIWAARG